MSEVVVKFKLLSPDAKPPFRATAGSAGWDLYSVEDYVLILPGQMGLVRTGIALALPEGYEGQIRSRSGLARSFGVFVLNSPGTIDSDFRGEVSVIIMNLSKSPFQVPGGLRVAQLVIAEVPRVRWEAVGELGDTVRGQGGCGSTGLR